MPLYISKEESIESLKEVNKVSWRTPRQVIKINKFDNLISSSERIFDRINTDINKFKENIFENLKIENEELM